MIIYHQRVSPLQVVWDSYYQSLGNCQFRNCWGFHPDDTILRPRRSRKVQVAFLLHDITDISTQYTKAWQKINKVSYHTLFYVSEIFLALFSHINNIYHNMFSMVVAMGLWFVSHMTFICRVIHALTFDLYLKWCLSHIIILCRHTN